MLKKINFGDEFYQKLKLLVLPITVQQFMLALVSATDAIMLGAVLGQTGRGVDRGGHSDRTAHQPDLFRYVYHTCSGGAGDADAHFYQ